MIWSEVIWFCITLHDTSWISFLQIDLVHDRIFLWNDMIWLRHLPTMTWHHQISDDTMIWHYIISYDTISYYILKLDLKLNVVLHISFVSTLLPTFLPFTILNLLILVGNTPHSLHNIYQYYNLCSFNLSHVTWLLTQGLADFKN